MPETPPPQQPSPPPPPSQRQAPAALIGLRPTTFPDLVADLAWPTLLRAPAMALRPERFGLALLACALFFVLGWLLGLPFGWGNLADRFVALKSASIAWFLAPAYPSPPWGEAGAAEWTAMGLMGVIALFLWCLFGGAIGRSVGCEVAEKPIPGARAVVAGALHRLPSLLIAVAAPGVIAGALFAIAAVIVRALSGVAVLDLVGAALLGPVILLGAILALIALVQALAGSMLAPAVVCEASDGVDAIQRVYAYTLHRPIRLIVYALIAAALGAAILLLTTWALRVGVMLTLWVSGSPLAEGGPAQAVAQFWFGALALISWAFALSYVHSAGAVMYLLLREVTDGQDRRDLAPDASDRSAE